VILFWCPVCHGNVQNKSEKAEGACPGNLWINPIEETILGYLETPMWKSCLWKGSIPGIKIAVKTKPKSQ
jgi:hypothetical protein